MTTVSVANVQGVSRATTTHRWLPNLVFMTLLGFVVLSALSIIYIKDYSRRSFSELQQLQQARDQAQVAWGQLLLEQTTCTTQARIQSLASHRLTMQVPEARFIARLPL